MKCGNRLFGNSRFENSFIVNSKLADEFVGLGSTGLNKIGRVQITEQ